MANEGASPASEHKKCAIEHKMGTINPELGNKCLTEIPLLNKMAESLNKTTNQLLSSCEAGADCPRYSPEVIKSICDHCDFGQVVYINERGFIDIEVQSDKALDEYDLSALYLQIGVSHIVPLEEKVEVLGRELMREVRRLTRLVRVLARQLEQYDGHFLNLDKRTFNLEEKQGSAKKPNYKTYKY